MCSRVVWTDLNSLQSDLPEHSTPQGIVKIDDQCFAHHTGQRMKKFHPFVHHRRKTVRVERHSHCLPLALVVPSQASVPGNQLVVVEYVHTSISRTKLSQSGVKSIYRHPPPVCS